MSHKIDENYFIKNNDSMHKNNIEDLLEKDEKILLKLKPDKKTYRLESIFSGALIGLLWAGIDAGILSIIIVSGAFNEMHLVGKILLICFFAIHLIPFWLMIYSIIKNVAGYKNIEYFLTNKRVITRSGLIGIDIKSIYYSDVIGVNVKVGLFDRIFKVGDIYISAKQQSTAILDVKDPYFLMNRIQKITHDIKTDIIFPNDLRPKENHGYNTDYKDIN